MRLFVAIDLPTSLRTRLSWMSGGLQGARWVPPENYHVTLRFIGEVPGWRAEELDLALAGLRAPGFELQLSGVGTHEKGGKVTALWIGVDRTPALDHLQSKMQGRNLFRSDTVPVEHFTLFRSRLGKEQAVYDAEVEYPLLPPSPDVTRGPTALPERA